MAGAAQQLPRRAGRRPWLLFAVPGLAILIYGLYGSRQFRFDTLERGYLLDHPKDFLRSWNGTERSQFFFFAHPLELPLAWLVGRALPFLRGHDVLRCSGILSAAGSLSAMGGLAWIATRSLGLSILAQLVLATSLGFWYLATGGEERIPALASQLLFLWCFWRVLASGRGALWVGVTLCLAILVHLTGAVLVPFAALALFVPPRPTADLRRRLALATGAGTAAACVALAMIAAWTTHVHSLGGFLDYATYYHRVSGNNFFELSGVKSEESRLLRAAFGIGSFFAGSSWTRAAVLLALTAAITLACLAWRRDRTNVRDSGPGFSRPTALVHCALLAGLWTAHFLFYEPKNFESWTLLGALLILGGAVASTETLPRFIFMLLPVLLLGANIPHYRFNHQPLNLETTLRNLQAASRPNDILLVLGGRQNGLPIRGSLWTRFILAREPTRTVASLYDVLRVSQREYWPRPFRSPEELQAALAAGRRCYSPAYMSTDFDQVRAAKLAEVDYVLRGPVLEITGIRRGERFEQESLPPEQVE